VNLLLLVNTSASSVTARGRVVIQKALSADHDVVVEETNRRGHATRLAQKGATSGVEVVVVLGGDGTLNEAANGLAGTTTALAALPGGSTNVFARTLGLPDDPVEATGMLLDALARRDIERVGLGSVNRRYFLFHVGMGFDAAVVAQVERQSTLKRYASHPLFAYCALTTWFRHYDRSRPRLALHFADGTVVDDSYFSVVFNTNPYTYVGTRPFNAAPDATLHRGLAALSFRTLDAVPFLGLAGSALFTGEHLRRSRHTDYRHDLTGLSARGHGPFPYQVDGDHLGEATDLEFRWEPQVLDLVLP
jgi:diacylglycerol kinase family enzyme